MGILGTTVAPGSITVITNDGNTLTITSESHMNYDKIREAIKVRDYEEVQTLIDLAAQEKARYASIAGNVRIEHGVLYLKNRAISGVLADRVIQMHNEGFDMEPMFAFVENLYENPSKRAVTQLYGFLEATDLPITEDGHFLAYKMVRENYTDCRTGTFDNSVGAIVEMDRNEVDEDPENTCSTGLHFCSQNYLGFYGSGIRTMILKINPRDVVSIPTDYKNSKGRACRYEIVGEFMIDPTKSHSFGTTVASEAMQKTGANPFKRKYTYSGNVKVYTDNQFAEGDVVFKRAVVDRFGVDMDALTTALENEELESTVNSSGHYLPVVDEGFRIWVRKNRTTWK